VLPSVVFALVQNERREEVSLLRAANDRRPRPVPPLKFLCELCASAVDSSLSETTCFLPDRRKSEMRHELSNRDNPIFKNRCKLLPTNDIAFSNRDKSATSASPCVRPLLLLALLFAAPGAHAQPAPLRVAIAGLAHGHIFGFLQTYQHDPRIEIVGIAEADQAFASRVADQYKLDKTLFYADLDDMLAKTHPQVVLAYTNTFDHRRVVETCARHKIDVMMEKPLAVSVADARAIEKAARDAHIKVMVNYETTWYASNRAAYDLLHQHAIGDMRKFVARDGHQGPKEIGVGPEFLSWLTDPKLDGGGALFDFGCYGADLMTWLMDNQRPLTVTAVTQQIKPDLYPHVDDEATIVLTYAKAQAIIQASWNWPFSVKDIQVYGQTGYVKTVERDNILVRRQGEHQEQQVAATPLPAPDNDPVAYLRAVVLDGKKIEGPTSLETNVIVTEILDAARESAATGKTIQLPRER
jgi:glucose-fructose oxidoreductase